MKKLDPYLIFNGTCKEAMEFYKESLDGEIESMRTFGDSPLDVSEDIKHRIFDSQLRAQDIVIRASDSLPENKITTGNNFALFVNFTSKKEQQKAFSILSQGGKIIMDLSDPQSGPNFGMLVDKFGIQWMLNIIEQ